MEIQDSASTQPDPIDVTHTTPDDQADPKPVPSKDKRSRIDYLKSLAPPPKPKRKWPMIATIVILLLLLAGGGAYWYANHHKTKKAAVNTPTTSSTVQPSTTTAVTLKHYISNGTDLNLNFDYPSDWTITPPSGSNSSDQTITLSSPLTTITGADGKSVTGRVTIRLRPANIGLTELTSGVSTAGQASVQFAYKKPTTNQFQYPYLDFIHLLGGSNPTSAFEEVLISGSNKFTKDQTISDASVAVDPIITANIYSCKTNACAGNDAVPLGITNNTWTNTTVFQQTLAIFQSLQIN